MISINSNTFQIPSIGVYRTKNLTYQLKQKARSCREKKSVIYIALYMLFLSKCETFLKHLTFVIFNIRPSSLFNFRQLITIHFRTRFHSCHFNMYLSTVFVILFLIIIINIRTFFVNIKTVNIHLYFITNC